MRLNEELFSPTKTFTARGAFLSFLKSYKIIDQPGSKRGGLLTLQEAMRTRVNRSIGDSLVCIILHEFGHLDTTAPPPIHEIVPFRAF